MRPTDDVPAQTTADAPRGSTAYVIGPFGAGTRAAGPSAPLPYGVQHLAEHGVEVTYADPAAARARHLLPVRALLSAVHRRTRLPVLEPVLEPSRLHNADLLICVLEDNISVLAPALRLLRRHRPSVLVVVWLTAELADATASEKRRWRRRLTAFSTVVVFSANQVSLLTETLGLPDGLVQAVPFGVAPLPPTPPGDGGVLTVGTDRGRDFATFVAALRDAPVAATILTNAAHRAQLGDVAPIRVLGPEPRERYLELLAHARIVVSPTHVLAYPTGQTVLLEAMKLGRACVVTGNPALADYVTDGHDVVLVPAADPAALRAAVQTLDADPVRRAELGTAAARTAARFTESAMWAAVLTAARPSP